MTASDPLDHTGGWAADTDVPQVDRKDPPDHDEAYWLYGYDPATSFGYYLYLAAERDDEHFRRESVFLYVPDGSVLAASGGGRGSRQSVAAGDCLEFQCVEPFRRWIGRYVAPMQRLVGDEMVAGPQSERAPVDVRLEVEIETASPPWNTEGDWGEDPPSFRYHQFYVARGEVQIDGTLQTFGGNGFRSHSRRRRELPGFTGHAITNALFPGGRGFGLLRYRATADRPERGRGFLYLDGVMHDADVIDWPHLSIATPKNDGVWIELRAAGRSPATIIGRSVVSPFVTVGSNGRQLGAHPDTGPGFVLAPAIARFEWDGEVAYGPLERSVTSSQLAIATGAGPYQT